MSVVCPIECVRGGCPDQDFLQRNGTWLLTVIAGLSGCFGMLLTYFLKSRCKVIKCGPASCIRDVVELNPRDIEISSSKATE